MKILLATCTKSSREDMWNTPLYKSAAKYNLYACATLKELADNKTLLVGKVFDLLINHSHTSSLTGTYNKCIRYAHENNYDVIILAHDDVSIEDVMLTDKLKAGFTNYSVIGLAGATSAKISSPALWHIMSQQAEWRGSVCHKNVAENKWGWTHFGHTPSRVLILDGLFLACKVKDLIDKDVNFDENIPHGGYHHYDILFSLKANKNGLKLATWPIWAVHDSPGLADVTEKYKQSEQYFLKVANLYL